MLTKHIHPIDLYAGERLREARKELGLSQDELVKRLEHPITFQQLQKYESGRNHLSASILWEFSQVLDLPPEFFFPPFSEDAVQCRGIQKTRLLQLFRGLSADRQQALLILLEQENSG